MNVHHMNRREAMGYLTSIGSGLAIASTVDATDTPSTAAASDELSHHASAIHQEILFLNSMDREGDRQAIQG